MSIVARAFDDQIPDAYALDEIVLRQRLAGSRVPEHLHEGLAAYLVEHHPAGSFLMACLSNDLLTAAKSADEQSRRSLAVIVLWLYDYAPAMSWGSTEAVAIWLKTRQEGT